MKNLPNVFNELFNELDDAFTKSPFFGLVKEVDSLLPFPKFQLPNFPPTDIIKKDNEVIIQMAVAGFTKEDLTISFDEDRRVLTVEGKTEKQEKEEGTYLVRQIAKREIRSVFPIMNPTLKVVEAKVENGMLTIKLVSDKVEKEPTKIDIK